MRRARRGRGTRRGGAGRACRPAVPAAVGAFDVSRAGCSLSSVVAGSGFTGAVPVALIARLPAVGRIVDIAACQAVFDPLNAGSIQASATQPGQPSGRAEHRGL